jgi:methionyl-tRNA formyltransferase
MKEIRLVILGTPEFAVPALLALHETYRVVAVVTQPDKPGGRGQKKRLSPVKKEALQLGLPVLQPEKIRDGRFLTQLNCLAPDFLVTVAYGRILPAEILAVPRVAALNIHASLLPRYRGAAPIQRAVINGETESGVTIMYMDAGMDTGDIALQEPVAIGFTDTAGDLHDKLAEAGARLIVDAMTGILAGRIERSPQEASLATYAPPLLPEEEKINWQVKAAAIHNLVRGMSPRPGAYTLYRKERLKILAGTPGTGNAPVSGKILSVAGGKLLVAAGEGIYSVDKVQPQGGRVMTAAEYLRGNSLPVGTVLGD